MANQRHDKTDSGGLTWADADLSFDRLRADLPPDAVSDVAAEVLRRLAFRLPRFGAGTEAPGQAEVARFCSTLTAAHDDSAERFIRNLRRAGNSPHTIYMSYIAAAARHFGTAWEEDTLSFAEVTMASGRLFRIIRSLRHVLDRDGPAAADSRRVLLALMPDETHTLGCEMAADMMRRDGWIVDLSVGADHDGIVAQAAEDGFAAIVLVGYHPEWVDRLSRLVVALRIVAPLTPLALAGRILDRPDVVTMCGLDGQIDTLDGATACLSRISAAAQARHAP